MTDQLVVLITGSRKGIGRYLVEHFIQLGAVVHGCSRTSPDWQMPGYIHHLADVTDEAQVKAMFSIIRKQYDRLDIVVNNAGIASMNHMLVTPVDTANKIMNTNVLGTFLISRESAKIMRNRRFGRIINLSSVAVALNLEGEALYSASKSAIEQLTRVMARELAEFSITCNCIGPTPINTDLIKNVSAEKIQALVQRQAIKRLGTFSDVANVIDFLVRPESDFVTGQVIYLGGV
jgi:3-oxoacyl-[acyl-carrier protein] reductase